MGKGTLIIVLGISAVLALMVVGINANSNASLDTTLDFYKTTQARLIANSGIEIYLEKLRRNKSLKGNFYNNDFSGGEYDIFITGTDTLMKIKSVARFSGRTHTSLVTAKRTPVTIPNINSAVYVSAQNLSLNLNGNLDIDGRDHFMDGTLSGGVPLPGIGVDDPADSAFIVNSLKPKISNSIKGAGASPSVRTVKDLTDWKAISENFIFASDITLPTGTYSSGTLGTSSDPKITFVNGDVNFSGSASGYGIMVVNGNVQMSGNFTFKGILIAYGKSTIETKTVGNAGVHGASIFVGENIDIQATGNANFFYSNQAIQNAKNNLKSSRFDILSWWE